MGLRAMFRQPPYQPEAVTAGFEGNGDACDEATALDSFVTPTVKQPQ